MLGRRLFGLTIVAALLSLAGWGLFRLNRMFEPDRHGAKVTHFTVRSTLVARALEEIVVAPKGGGAGRPLLVLLPGRGSSPDSYLTRYWFDALARLRSRAPDLLLVGGGDHSYYHDRADGRWGSYVLNEAIPAAVARLGADRGRIAIGGISMGGFGALRFGLQSPGLFCAVGGHSPAIWRTGGETPEGAFDNAEDFDRNDVTEISAGRFRPLGDTRVWIDVGDQDPFASADRELARVLLAHGQKITFHVWPGSHSGSYWNKHIDRYLRFYAEALAAC
ncbi:MAG: alpha/beta hydrolase-fold protein [Gaiellaceae bacterium]